MNLLTSDGLPARVEGLDRLEELMTRPTRALVDDLAAPSLGEDTHYDVRDDAD